MKATRLVRPRVRSIVARIVAFVLIVWIFYWMDLKEEIQTYAIAEFVPLVVLGALGILFALFEFVIYQFEPRFSRSPFLYFNKLLKGVIFFTVLGFMASLYLHVDPEVLAAEPVAPEDTPMGASLLITSVLLVLELSVLSLFYRVRLKEAENGADLVFRTAREHGENDLVFRLREGLARSEGVDEFKASPEFNALKAEFEGRVHATLIKAFEMVTVSYQARVHQRGSTYSAWVKLPVVRKPQLQTTDKVAEFESIHHFRTAYVTTNRGKDAVAEYREMARETLRAYDPSYMEDIVMPKVADRDQGIARLYGQWQALKQLEWKDEDARETSRKASFVKKQLESRVRSFLMSKQGTEYRRDLQRHSSITGYVFSTENPHMENVIERSLFYDDTVADQLAKDLKFRSSLSVVVSHSGFKLGVLQLLSTHARAFVVEDQYRLEIAGLFVGRLLAIGAQCGFLEGVPSTEFPRRAPLTRQVVRA